MTIKMMKRYAIGIVLLMFLVPLFSRAQDVQFTAGQVIEITLTSPSVTYTLSSTTGISSFTVSGSTATFTLDAGDDLTVNQASGFTIQNNVSAETQCVGATSQIRVTQTVTITSNSTVACTGGGGGGGGAPADDAISINGGAAQTNIRSVTLTLFANGATQTMVANTLTFTSASWEPYATIKPWTLTEGVGEKRVYVKFRSAVGQATAPISGVITLVEATAPAPTTPTTPSTPLPTPTPSQLPAGSLVKMPNNPTVYVYEQGALRPILNGDIFEAKGYRWGDIKEIGSIAAFTIGMTVDYSGLPITQSSLIKGADNKVYLIYDNKKWWIQNEQTFAGLGFQWSSVKQVSDVQLASFADGTVITSTAKHPDGTLIKYANSSKVYFLDKGKKRWVPSEQAFRINGFRFKDVVVVPLSENYEEGASLATSVLGYSTGDELPFRNYLKLGSVGDEVRLLQQTLQKHRFYPVNEKITGSYAQKTRQAVIDFQKYYGMQPLGVVGPATRAKLNQLVGK